MWSFIVDNISTIVVLAILIVIVVAIIRKMIRDKKNNKCSCGGNCSGCGSASICHSLDNYKK